MEEDELIKVLVAYLKKKGMTATELAFQAEQQSRNSSSSASKTDPDIAKQILSLSEKYHGCGYATINGSLISDW
ncbi:hypothetical protein FRX31_034040 [Thalictrum thalictroides]|uniref:LisH domain-containing protein n=1 Tax=Thalictrum thalictroides TaxID=46969 RepID=A0A7J6UUU4_THATH|nr:hypothetical protein FRX31_034040 [Thalictrum thalictroides]